MTLGNPTFTAWTTLTNDNNVMTFSHSEISAGKALLYLEDTNWTDWTAPSTPTADQQADIDTILATYDGYVRSVEITTNMSTDFGDGEWFGACFYKYPEALSCIAYQYTLATTTYTAFHKYVDMY